MSVVERIMVLNFFLIGFRLCSRLLIDPLIRVYMSSDCLVGSTVFNNPERLFFFLVRSMLFLKYLL